MFLLPSGSLPSPAPPVAPRPRATPRAPEDRVELSGRRAQAPAGAATPRPAERLQGRLEVDGAAGAPMAPGIPAAWTFRFQDAEGRPVTSFEPEHEKPMHLWR